MSMHGVQKGAPLPYRVTTADEFRDFAPTPGDRLSRRAIAVIVAVTAAALGLALAFADNPVQACLLLPILPIGVFRLNQRSSAYSMSRRLRGSSCTPIHDAQGGVVAIRGRVLPSDMGLFVAPADGQEAVWARVVVSDFMMEFSDRILSETASRDFLIDDGSGEHAYIVARRARVLLNGTSARGIENFSPSLRALLEARGAKQIGSATTVTEFVLKPGDEVIAIGPSERAPVAGERGTSAPTSQLILGRGNRRGSELLLATWPPSSATFAHALLDVLGGLMLVVAGAALPAMAAWRHFAAWWHFQHG
jgi:hypothetical protein